MKMMIQTCLFGLLLCLGSGCYSSAPPREDAASDPVPDPTHDPVVDPIYDPYPDPYYDPYVDPAIDPFYDPWMEPDIPTRCPPPLDIWIDFDVSGAPTTGPDGMERECFVEWSFSDMDWIEIGLACMEPDGQLINYVIDINAYPAAYVFIPDGTPVTFSYMIDDPWWMNRWFAIRYLEGPLFLAAVDATDLAPYGRDPYEWYGPLGVFLATGTCPWTWGDCGDEERVALGLSLEGMNDFVFDGNESWIGMWSMVHVLVETAVVYHNIRCEDFYDSWIRALFVSMPVR